LVVNRNKQTAEDTDYTTETGEAYGVDFSVKYDVPRLYVWGTYSYGIVNRNDGEQIYPTIFDRRHNVNFLATYSLDKEDTWEAIWGLAFHSQRPVDFITIRVILPVLPLIMKPIILMI